MRALLALCLTGAKHSAKEAARRIAPENMFPARPQEPAE